MYLLILLYGLSRLLHFLFFSLTFFCSTRTPESISSAAYHKTCRVLTTQPCALTKLLRDVLRSPAFYSQRSDAICTLAFLQRPVRTIFSTTKSQLHHLSPENAAKRCLAVQQNIACVFLKYNRLSAGFFGFECIFVRLHINYRSIYWGLQKNGFPSSIKWTGICCAAGNKLNTSFSVKKD